MKNIKLNGVWQGTCILPDEESFDFEGRIPGSAINDLIAAGKLPHDIFFEDNADKVLEFELCDYKYSKIFYISDKFYSARLRFERLDTYCDVYLNGILVYHSENGNIAHEIDVESYLKKGENLLEICLYSPITAVKDKPERNGAFTKERMNTRRMQCTYGWDWVARFVTCSIGDASILLYEKDEVITNDVYVTVTDILSHWAGVRVDIGFDKKYSGRILDFIILSPNGNEVCHVKKYCAEDFVRIDFDIPNPMLWYPLGYGEQPLYIFLLLDGEKEIAREIFGVRKARIVQLPDEVGSANYEKCLSFKNEKYDFNEAFSGFYLMVNEKKIFCRGANWVPCEPFSMGDNSKKITRTLELCAKAGVNMLRIWGGGAFESEHFYDECSRFGITVTQDFLMACGEYPEDEDWFIEELQKEAKYAARLIRNKACLMWWSGDNENAVDGCDTDKNYPGRKSAYYGIAPILYREDPVRRFLPSSPYGGKKYASNTVGTTHNTQYLGKFFGYMLREDVSDYKDHLKNYRARFIAEEPQLGAVSLSSIRHFMRDEDIFSESEMWYYHMKCNPAVSVHLFDHLDSFARHILGGYEDSIDRYYKLRYIQYEWLRVTMEQARREDGLCSGIIFWMMNDCWPASAGWALIDYYNLPKDAFYSFKRCSKKLLSSIDKDNGTYKIYIINEDAQKEVSYALMRVSDNGTEQIRSGKLIVGAGSHMIMEYDGTLEDNELLVLDIRTENESDRAFYKNGALNISPCEAKLIIDEKK
ncbi:MAG: hypothetical protein IKK94_02070, partial [Clostridia bacterium]|nr:hypothetical protein [Clostridia bacterium]